MNRFDRDTKLNRNIFNGYKWIADLASKKNSIETVCEFLNNKFPLKKLTVETQKLEFDIFREEINTYSYIPNHCIQQKMAILKLLVDSLLLFPLTPQRF